MINELFDSLKYEDLDEEQQLLADCVGFNSYKKLIADYGGASVYIQTRETLCAELRNKMICKEFDGGNYKQLAKKYGLSEITVRRVVAEGYKNKVGEIHK